MTATRQTEAGSGHKHPILRQGVAITIKAIVSVAILIGAVMLYRHQMATSPRVTKMKPKTSARLVQVVQVEQQDKVTSVHGNGTVMAARQVVLRPQVSGRIVSVSDDLVPGGMIEAGSLLMSVDPNDYETAVAERQSDVAKAERDLKVEEGSGEVAKREYELLGEVVTEEDRDLMLRKPHLMSAEAVVTSAKAALSKAQLDLKRCRITAPFNSLVDVKHVELGATVSSNTDLVTLIGTDEAWIEVMVFVHQLKWLDIPKENGDLGPVVKIENPGVWQAGQYRLGRALRLVGELETEGRLAKVLVSVKDPFCLKKENRNKPKLLMGSYVSATIEGRKIASVFPVKWPQLRENDTVWIMNDKNELEIRPVTVLYRDYDSVYVSAGLSAGDRMVVTDIAAPMAGMPLRLDDELPTGEAAVAVQPEKTDAAQGDGQ